MNKRNQIWIVRPYGPEALILFSKKLIEINIFFLAKDWHHHIYGLNEVIFIIGIKCLCKDQLGGCCNCPGKGMKA